MSSPPSSPTPLVVSSPRKTLSLLRERRSSTFSFDPEEKKSPAAVAGFAAEHGPKPSEVYGFVGSITTVIATVIYLVWAYTPEPWLHSLGITYYPSKIWALAVPTFVMVTVALVIAIYIGLNFMVTPPPTSFSTMFDFKEEHGFKWSCYLSGRQHPRRNLRANVREKEFMKTNIAREKLRAKGISAGGNTP